MSFPRYPEYKDSGVEWLGKVPTHWAVIAIKRVCAVVGGSTPKSDQDDYWDGEITWVTPADLSRLTGFEIHESMRTITSAGLASCGTTIVPEGSIVLSTRAPIGSLGIAAKALCTNQGCKALVPNGPNSRLLAYLLTAGNEALNVRGKGTTFLELSSDELGAFLVPLGTSEEQTAIATFLDRETAKIDALVAEQEMLIALLQEKRQAVISHAVTKGLDPNVPMKDSGVECLGEVPGHWISTKLSRMVTKIGDGLHGTPEYVDDSEFRFINGNNLSGGSISFTDSTRCVSEEEFNRYRIQIDRTTLLLSINGTIGNVALYQGESVMLGKSAAYINCGDQLSREFLCWFLQSSEIGLYFEYSVTGTTIFNLSLESIRRMPIAVPPMDEQMEIVQRMTEQIGDYDGLLEQAQRAIDLLQERRNALISAAVTGQIDVRGIASRDVS